jgi:hypothetical protein
MLNKTWECWSVVSAEKESNVQNKVRRSRLKKKDQLTNRRGKKESGEYVEERSNQYLHRWSYARLS